MVIMIKTMMIKTMLNVCLYVSMCERAILVNLALMTHWADVTPTSICRGPPVPFESPSQLFLYVCVCMKERISKINRRK